MRNIAYTTTSSLEGLKKAGKGLHRMVVDEYGVALDNPKHLAYHGNKEDLKHAYNEYDQHTNPCRLEGIVPLPLSASHIVGLKGLYDRKRPFIQSLWNEIAYETGEYIMCPLCGQKVVADLDHYIPRSKMPEYSVHLLNLIPTCHECNENKGELWLGVDKKRLIFNAYFDKLGDIGELISPKIIIDADSVYPRIELSLNEVAIASSGEVGRLVASTYNSIKSIREQWKFKASSTLKIQIRRIISSVKVRKRSGKYTEGDWGFERAVMNENILLLSSHEFIERIVYENMLDSDEFNVWLVDQLNKI